ncbi:hypothetical protein K458DRAFT_492972 [Lentithecium fluviatile CBS 122367]|uniref:Uncharacterized protein n=1 Tax=Lentithecium fluviatile CBS 122367 TaxID=1168545 RepID=A0A6G1ICB4_9PLEO|nr:hypothetical protein K458DRAFT_492972 [Lentithecium fluviatile CBS 122367]
MQISKAPLLKKRTTGMRFARRDLVLPLNATGKRKRMQKSKQTPVSKPGTNTSSKGTMRKTVFGPGTRLGDGPDAPLPVDDSEDDERHSQRQHNQLDTSDWLEASVRPTNPIFAPDIKPYRYTPSTSDRIDPSIDQTTDIEHDHGFSPRKDSSSFQIAVRSKARQPSVESVFVLEERSVGSSQLNGSLRQSRIAYPYRTSLDASRTIQDRHSPSTTAYPTETRIGHGLWRENSEQTCFTDTEGSRPTTMRELKNAGRISRLGGPTPSLGQPRARVKPIPPSAQPLDNKPPKKRPYPSAAIKGDIAASRPSIEREFTLADIPDFGLRIKVANLIEIVPHVPVQDLYDLLLDSKGHYEGAEAQVFRQLSQTPLPTYYHHDSVPATKSALSRKGDEEVMVKVDLDDPDIYLESDAPPSPSPLPAPKKATSRKPKKLPTKSNGSTKVSTESRPRATPKIPATNSTSELEIIFRTKPRGVATNIEMKRPAKAPRPGRAKGLERDFIVVDGDSEDDGSYGEKDSVGYSDDSGSDIAMDEDLATSLYIDMRRPFHESDTMMDTA